MGMTQGQHDQRNHGLAKRVLAEIDILRDFDLPGLLEAIEQEYMIAAMDRCRDGGNRPVKSQAAALLGYKRTTFVERLKKFGLLGYGQ